MNTSRRFWYLVEVNKIPAYQLSQITNAPYKLIVRWFYEGVPEDALAQLERHLGITKTSEAPADEGEGNKKGIQSE